MQNKKKIILTVIYIIIVALILWGFAYFNKTEAPAVTTTTSLDIFAKCVAEKGLTMYGAVWCSHCTAEKKAFGESFKYVPYVECPDNVQLCIDKGINGYPTWIDGAGKKYEGEQGLKGLAKISGCILP